MCQIAHEGNSGRVFCGIDHCFQADGRSTLLVVTDTLDTEHIATSCDPWTNFSEYRQIQNSVRDQPSCRTTTVHDV